MSWRPISRTYLKPAVVMSAVGGVLPSRIALVAVVVPCRTRMTSPGARPASASALRTAVRKPAERSPGVDGVLATHVAPVPASANVTSVNVPPTSMAIVPGIGSAHFLIGVGAPSQGSGARRSASHQLAHHTVRALHVGGQARAPRPVIAVGGERLLVGRRQLRGDPLLDLVEAGAPGDFLAHRRHHVPDVAAE